MSTTDPGVLIAITADTTFLIVAAVLVAVGVVLVLISRRPGPQEPGEGPGPGSAPEGETPEDAHERQ